MHRQPEAAKFDDFWGGGGELSGKHQDEQLPPQLSNCHACARTRRLAFFGGGGGVGRDRLLSGRTLFSLYWYKMCSSSSFLYRCQDHKGVGCIRMYLHTQVQAMHMSKRQFFFCWASLTHPMQTWNTPQADPKPLTLNPKP
jgi:hypothetical protein